MALLDCREGLVRSKRYDISFLISSYLISFCQVLEVTTWTQLGIHDKRMWPSRYITIPSVLSSFVPAVVLCNVLGFWDPLRQLIRHSIQEGFIRDAAENLVVFVDGPANPEEHITFDWGTATLAALDSWNHGHNKPPFDWAQKMNGATDKEEGKWIAT